MKILLLSIIVLCFFVSCKGGETEKHTVNHTEKMTYPYRASKERLERISKESRSIVVGMSKKEVLTKLGEPDEINDTLDKNNWNRKTGCSFVYIQERKKEKGSVIEKGEKLVRIYFDLKGRVIKLIFVGM